MLIRGHELGPVAMCLLEVVAEDLVVIAEALPLASLRLEPPREALVSSARTALGIPAYVSSQMSEWRKRYASSPGTSPRSGLTRPLRRAS